MPRTKNLPRSASRFYVYALVDSRDDEIFYIGKGTGLRCYQHEARVRSGLHENARVSERISTIWAAGASVRIDRLASDLSESEALQRERAAIAEYRWQLCNISPGHRSGEERQREWAHAFIRRLKPLRQVLTEGRCSRDEYLRILKEAAKLYARPEPTTFTMVDGKCVGSF